MNLQKRTYRRTSKYIIIFIIFVVINVVFFKYSKAGLKEICVNNPVICATVKEIIDPKPDPEPEPDPGGGDDPGDYNVCVEDIGDILYDGHESYCTINTPTEWKYYQCDSEQEASYTKYDDVCKDSYGNFVCANRTPTLLEDQSSNSDDPPVHNPECSCGSANDTVIETAPSGGSLCNAGTSSEVSADGEFWTWTCTDPPEECPCKASCDYYNITIDTPNFLYVQDQNDVTVRLVINGLMNNIEDINCTLNEEPVSFTADNNESDEIIFSDVDLPFALTAKCTYTVLCGGGSGDASDQISIEKEITVNGMCISRNCNSNDVCQLMSMSATSPDQCKSTCDSNSDCSRDHMIETRP